MALSDTPIVATTMADDNRSYVDWPAIFAGAIFATAISFVLLTFGSAIGLSLTSANEGEGTSLAWLGIIAGLWVLWVQVSSFLAGGYLTGRMRRRHGDATGYESDIRDGSHGLIMWALSVLVGAYIAFAGISGAVSTAASAGSAVASAAGSVAGEAVDQNGLLIDRMLRTDPAAPAQPNAAAAGEDARAEIGRVLMTTVGDGELSDADRTYLVNTVAARAGVPPEEAQKRVDELVAQANELEADARAAAEQTRKAAMITAFITAAALFISAAAAYFGATLGGNHRDKQTVFADWYKAW